MVSYRHAVYTISHIISFHLKLLIVSGWRRGCGRSGWRHGCGRSGGPGMV